MGRQAPPDDAKAAARRHRRAAPTQHDGDPFGDVGSSCFRLKPGRENTISRFSTAACVKNRSPIRPRSPTPSVGCFAALPYCVRTLDDVEKKRDRVTPLCRTPCHAALVVNRPPPISLRIRSAEATDRARKLLRRLDEDDRLQRRVRWLAMKAIVSIREMNGVAAPKLRSMYASDRDRWQAQSKLAESILLKISKLGV
jgi:hypothetical protein